MAKVRVSDLAKQMGISDKDLLFKLQSLGVQVENASAAIDHEVIVAILTGKKLATRPRNVIMRDEKPAPEKKAVVVKPPRPIVKPPKREQAAAAEPVASTTPTPIIPEFIEAAEAEQAEQERAAKEPPKPRVQSPRRQTPAPAPASAPAPTAAPPPGPATPAAAAPPAAAPAPARSSAPAAAQPAPSAAAQAGRTGATGPRARMVNSPRPNYQGQAPVRDTRTPMERPRPSGGETRPPGGYSRPGSPRPGMDTRSGQRPMGGPGMRPGGRPGALMPPPPPVVPAGPTVRRKKVDNEDERPEKKKTTGKRGKRSPQISNEDTGFFTKGPFSATAVLDEDAGGPDVVVDRAEDEEGAYVETTGEPKAPSTRRDVRKQAGPVSGRVLEFTRPAGKVTLTEGVTVKDLADKLGVKANDLMKHLLMKKGLMLSINAPLGGELALEIAKDLEIDAELVSFETALELESLERMSATTTGGQSVSRAPVITVMGHVDHGKTSLLDAIRETDVASGEAGGITQHIGASQVEKRGRKIVFLDTPGHEAFTLMRARGAKVTDIVILVVAADDGVMPQTREAIDHARAANVPMIVVINKIDKPNANVERVRRELADNGVLLEQWGGDVVSVEVSAIKKQGIDDVLEMILLTADLLDLKATPELPSRGVVLEARKEVGRGIVATVLVQDGTLRITDPFIAGSAVGRVRAMTDDRGNRLQEAGPATPVSVTGFDDMPNAGDTLLVVDEEARARAIGEMRQEKAKEARSQKGARVSLDQLFQRMQAGTAKDLNLIIKADVQGSVEVLRDTITKLSNEQVNVNVIHASVGAISTNDVLLASASEAIVIGFNVRPERNATELAEKEGIDIRLHTVIYQLADEIKAAMTGLLDPTSQEVFQGRAEVRNTFKVPKAGTIAGCHVTEGVIPRSAGVRLLRDNRVIHEGKIGSLRHFKNDVAEVRAGFECGISLERFQDVKVGDVIEAYRIEKTAGVLQQ